MTLCLNMNTQTIESCLNGPRVLPVAGQTNIFYDFFGGIE